MYGKAQLLDSRESNSTQDRIDNRADFILLLQGMVLTISDC